MEPAEDHGLEFQVSDTGSNNIKATGTKRLNCYQWNFEAVTESEAEVKQRLWCTSQ